MKESSCQMKKNCDLMGIFSTTDNLGSLLKNHGGKTGTSAPMAYPYLNPSRCGTMEFTSQSWLCKDCKPIEVPSLKLTVLIEPIFFRPKPIRKPIRIVIFLCHPIFRGPAFRFGDSVSIPKFVVKLRVSSMQQEAASLVWVE